VLELAGSVAAVVAVGSIAFGHHLRHGGFYYDDWAYVSAVRFDGFWSLTHDLVNHVIPGRPVLALLLPVPFALFGSNAALFLLLALVLTVLASASFFLFLRTVGLGPIHAGTIAVLSLVFPWSDAVRLWPTASMNNLAIVAYFTGTVVALSAVSKTCRRAIPLHALAVLLYLLSVLVYEAAAAAIALSLVLYRQRAPMRRALPHWLADVAAVVLSLSLSLVLTSRVRHVGSARERWRDIPDFARDGLSILASSFLPSSATVAAAKAIVLVVVMAFLAWALALARNPERRELRRWLRVTAGGVVGVAAGYFMFLGSGLHPAYAGVDNRVNTFAGFAYAALVYSLVMMVGSVLAERHRRLARALVPIATLLVVGGFVQRVRADVDHYDQATRLQAQELAEIRHALPVAPRRSTIYVFGFPAGTAPGVPIFRAPWDLTGAVRLTWHDPSLSALPIFRTGVACGRARMYPREFKPSDGSTYERSVFVDLATGQVEWITSRRACLQARRTFRPGPLVLGDGRSLSRGRRAGRPGRRS
jgi:MFS family permease